MRPDRPTGALDDWALVGLGYFVRTKSLGITFGGRLRIPIGLTEMPDGFIESPAACLYVHNA